MILQALCDYYALLAQAGEIAKPGYAPAGVSLALTLADDGTPTGLLPLKQQQQRGKKLVEVKAEMMLPAPVKKTVNIAANFLWDNAQYVLGLDTKGKPERARECFEAFRARHHALLDGTDVPEARALLGFLDRWDPADAAGSPLLEAHREELTAGANIVFRLARTGAYIHDCAAVQAAWDAAGQAADADGTAMPCLVTGQHGAVARLHPSIKGLRGGSAMGNSLVAFNARAFESYGGDEAQGLNAPVSKSAAFAYTTALNYLLRQQAVQVFGDTTLLYWAHSPEKIYADTVDFFLNPVEEESGREGVAPEAQRRTRALLEKLVAGESVGDGFWEGMDPRTRFYVLGLAPNSARIAVRFFWTDSFGQALENLARHHRDMAITHAPKDYAYVPLWAMLRETVSPNAREKASSPLMSGAVQRAIWMGLPYPDALFTSVLVRIRAERAINRGKAGIIKACLLRSTDAAFLDTNREVLTMSLNEQSTNTAYVLGRLFAVLEKAQKDAIPNLNATIKDRYFASACASPGTVFPTLLRLSNYHTAKAEYGGVSERRKQELLEKLDIGGAFPGSLSLPEQGLFILGYYHQQSANYAKSE